ncbi:MAG: transglycosylase SLT domain-containing protein [Clostridia bacterium]|nr:transglycosylase SLT domain-containing protein [Clostridia bacterium]
MTDTPTPRRTRRADRYREDLPAEAAPAAEPVIAPADTETSAQQYSRRRAQRYQPERPAVPEPAPAAETPASRTRTLAPQATDGAVPRPRHLQHTQVTEAPMQRAPSWQSPTAEAVPAVRRQPARRAPADDAPPVMDRPPHAPQRKAKPPRQRAARPRMPLWMTVCIVVMVFVLLGLFTAQSLMQAYLVTRQEERAAAYQRVVDRHPIYFKDIIERYAAENNLRPAFVAAIILNESSYRTDAVSSVGARGLMQLMPDTAEWIAGKLDVGGYSFDRMFDAESNIRFGTWYLGYLAKLFRGDPVLVAAAYHTGQGEVTSWLSDPSMSADGVTIRLENMIDGPTKSYAGRVTQDYAIYEALFYRTPDGDGADAVSVYASGS